jgi:hypothetical protein
MSISDEYSVDYSSDDGYSYDDAELNTYNMIDLPEKISRAEKTLDILRTYAWHRELDIFISNDCVYNLADILPDMLPDIDTSISIEFSN